MQRNGESVLPQQSLWRLPGGHPPARAFRNRGLPVAMGGPHATLMPYEVAEHADIVVVGEAEPLWRHILKDDLQRKPGLHEFHTGTVEVTLQNTRIYRHAAPADLSNLPHARRDLIQQVQDYRNLLERGHNLGIAIQAGIIFGFENDDRDIFQRTVDTFGDIGLDNATISLLVPYPGTPSYAMLDSQNRIIDKNWRHYNGKTHVVFQPRHMSPEQLLNGYEWAKTQFYSLRHIAKRLNISRTGLWWNIPRNLGYHLGLRGEVLARAALHQGSLGL